MNAKLKLIAERAAEDLIGFMQEAEDDILKAWHAAAEEAEVQETKAKFKLGYSITLDLDKDHMETALLWSVKHKVSRDAPIPDPDQIKLPLEDNETTVEVKLPSGKSTGPIPMKKFAAAVKIIKERSEREAAGEEEKPHIKAGA